MRITLGVDDYLLTQQQSVTVQCDYQQLVNAHMLVMGKTGMGKTTFLLKLIQQMQQFPAQPRIHVMDVHGDLVVINASSIRFSEATEYGLNPFAVSADPHFGGVRKKVQDFIATINGCHPIGARQESVMRHLITDLYAANGFFVENPASWALHDGQTRTYPKRYPNIDDACRFAFGKLKQLIIGSDSAAGRALEDLNKITSKLHRLAKQHTQDAELTEQAQTLRTKALATYRDYIENLATGKELDDLIRYDAKEVLRSVGERFENLKASGIFKSKAPPFHHAAPVWHYDITALREMEKRLFVEFRLQELFAQALEHGPVVSGSPSIIRDLIVIDEAHLFFRDDDRNILNTIAKEGRKFGLGLICASQSPSHFSEDFFANVATKIVLGVDQMYWDHLVRKMKIEANSLKYVRPFQVMGVQMANKGETRSRFTMVNIKQ